MKLPQVYIDGTKDTESTGRLTVWIAEQKIALTGRLFRTFAMLAIQRRNNVDDGWLYKDCLVEAAKHVCVIRADIKKELRRIVALKEWEPIENDSNGFYRLNTTKGKIRINLAGLQLFGDKELLAMLKMVDKKTD